MLLKTIFYNTIQALLAFFEYKKSYKISVCFWKISQLSKATVNFNFSLLMYIFLSYTVHTISTFFEFFYGFSRKIRKIVFTVHIATKVVFSSVFLLVQQIFLKPTTKRVFHKRRHFNGLNFQIKKNNVINWWHKILNCFFCLLTIFKVYF